MPRASLGRRILSVRLTPETLSALGAAPSERARIVLEQWAETQEPAAAETEQALEDSAAKLGPGQRAQRNRGEDRPTPRR